MIKERVEGIFDTILNKMAKFSYPRTKALSNSFKTSVEFKKFLVEKKQCRIDPKDLSREFKELAKAVKKV
jgi:hypothetical protein